MSRLRLGPWMRTAILILTLPLLVFTRRDWRGLEHVPAAGGVIVAANHISTADPLTLCDYVLHGARRIPRFLAKDSLFAGGGYVARTMRGAGQIPVRRDTDDASLALSHAVAALARGECVVLYPEGTVTCDPSSWPMVARTGVARLALLSGAPVVPVAQWGPHELFASVRRPGLRVRPRTRARVVAGPPVDLTRYQGSELTGEVLRAATDDIMRAITCLVEELRGEPAPTQAHDPRRTATASDDGTDGGTDERRTA